MDHLTTPGLRNQAGVRTFFRIAGPLVLAVALIMVVVALADFFSVFGSDELAMPSKFWMFFVALPLLAVGSWLSQAGYAGVAARYAAGELSPVAKDSAAYLTDGEGLLGVGRTVDDDPRSAAATGGPFCRSCGVRNDAEARFCDGCGQALG